MCPCYRNLILLWCAFILCFRWAFVESVLVLCCPKSQSLQGLIAADKNIHCMCTSAVNGANGARLIVNYCNGCRWHVAGGWDNKRRGTQECFQRHTQTQSLKTHTLACSPSQHVKYGSPAWSVAVEFHAQVEKVQLKNRVRVVSRVSYMPFPRETHVWVQWVIKRQSWLIYYTRRDWTYIVSKRQSKSHNMT